MVQGAVQVIFEGQVSLSTPFTVFLLELCRDSEMYGQAHMCDQRDVHPFGYHFQILRMNHHPNKTSSQLLIVIPSISILCCKVSRHAHLVSA